MFATIKFIVGLCLTSLIVAQSEIIAYECKEPETEITRI